MTTFITKNSLQTCFDLLLVPQGQQLVHMDGWLCKTKMPLKRFQPRDLPWPAMCAVKMWLAGLSCVISWVSWCNAPCWKVWKHQPVALHAASTTTSGCRPTWRTFASAGPWSRIPWEPRTWPPTGSEAAPCRGGAGAGRRSCA